MLFHSIACPPEVLPALIRLDALFSVSSRTPDELLPILPPDSIRIETDYPEIDAQLPWRDQLAAQAERVEGLTNFRIIPGDG